MFSTVPGLERPRASLRCWNEVYVSVRAAKAALFHRNPKGLSFSNDDDITVTGAGCDSNRRRRDRKRRKECQRSRDVRW
jgi:hypothetical protein